MTATETLTARKLYDTDATMRGFITSWDAERRCPMPLVDFLLEQGLEAAAEAARWAATEGKRVVLAPIKEEKERATACGPYPTMGYVGTVDGRHVYDWYWWSMVGKLDNACDVPIDHVGALNNRLHDGHEKSADAILWLLDNWRAPA